jgi:ketosteroid isomerase-like protein
MNAIKCLYSLPVVIVLAVLAIPAITFAQQDKKGKELETDTPLATAHKYLDAFNRGDVKGMAASFAVPGHILDGMAPHVWQGPTATDDWWKDVLREGKEHGASGYLVTVGEPLHNDITGDSAYIVLPATMTFDLKGTKVTQTGAVFTFALRKTADGWRVAAWAWAKGVR